MSFFWPFHFLLSSGNKSVSDFACRKCCAKEKRGSVEKRRKKCKQKMMYLAACKTAVDIYKCDHYIVADITVAINDPKKSKYLSCRNIFDFDGICQKSLFHQFAFKQKLGSLKNPFILKSSQERTKSCEK